MFIIFTIQKNKNSAKMTPKICSKSGQFLPCSKTKKPVKKQHGGMFAANMGQAMLDPRGAAAPPQENDSSDDEDAQLEMIRELLSRLPPPSAGGGKRKRVNKPPSLSIGKYTEQTKSL